jgi:hypothetical protein
VSTEVPVLLRLVGLNTAVAPVGRPVTPNVVAVAYPPVIVSVAVDVALPPALPERAVGEANSVKFCTVSAIVAVCVSVPLVPVMVSVDVPPATVEGTVTVRVEVPDPVTAVGLKLAVAFAGRPLTESPVVPVRPGVAATVIVNVPAAPPATTVLVVGEDDSAKSGETVRVAAAD